MFLALQRSALSSFCPQANLTWVMAIFTHRYINKLPAAAIKPFIFLVSWVLLSHPIFPSAHPLVYGLFRKLSYTRHTYHFNDQVWGFPLFIGDFRAHGVRTISTTKYGTFCFSQEIFVHATYVPWPPDNTGAHPNLSKLGGKNGNKKLQEKKGLSGVWTPDLQNRKAMECTTRLQLLRCNNYFSIVIVNFISITYVMYTI